MSPKKEPRQLESVHVYLEKNMLSQKDLGEELGISESHVWLLLKGKRNPSLDLLRRITSVCGVSADQLLKEIAA